MLSILAKLSIIKFEDFGLHCFNMLRDLMMSGKEMEVLILDVIQEQVINKLKGDDPTQLPVTLL